MTSNIDKTQFESFLKDGSQCISIAEALGVKVPNKDLSPFKKIREILKQVNVYEIRDKKGNPLLDQISEKLKGRIRKLMAENINPSDEIEAMKKLGLLMLAYGHFDKVEENIPEENWRKHFDLWDVCIEIKRHLAKFGDIHSLEESLDNLIAKHKEAMEKALDINVERE